MEVNIEAAYVRDCDINVRGNTLISLCYAAQKSTSWANPWCSTLNGYWAIYTHSSKTRAALIPTGLNINGTFVKVFDDKPFIDGGKYTERVVIKD